MQMFLLGAVQQEIPHQFQFKQQQTHQQQQFTPAPVAAAAATATATTRAHPALHSNPTVHISNSNGNVYPV